MTNIREISRLSGYSVSTVSRVLNDHPHVSKKAREKVTEIIQALDYTPNLIAKELSTGHTHKVGVVLPHVRHYYFSQMLNGMLDEAQASDYNLLLLPSQYDGALERQYLEELRGHAFDHLIFTSRTLSIDTIASYTKYGNILCLEEVSHPKLSSVYVDRRPAYLDAFTQLKMRGYQHLALLFSRQDTRSSTYRMEKEAYDAVYHSHPLIIEGITDEQDGYRAASKIWQFPEIDCVFANGDDVAVGVMRAYQEAGKRCPYLLGQENMLAGRLLGISTIDHRSYQVGQESFKKVISGEVGMRTLYSEFIPRGH